MQGLKGVVGHALHVARVFPDSTAAAAGLRRGDILISVSDTRITGPFKLVAAMTMPSAGRRR
jgi:S1-C subfamily serine protease